MGKTDIKCIDRVRMSTGNALYYMQVRLKQLSLRKLTDERQKSIHKETLRRQESEISVPAFILYISEKDQKA